MKIDKPGIFLDVDAADYFADPLPAASLTQSLCKLLLERSPRHAWLQSAKLNPAWRLDVEAYDKDKAIGNAAHRLLIGRGKSMAILDYPDFKTKEARKDRDAFAEQGLTPILSRHHEIARQMVVAAQLQLADHEASDVFTAGNGEVVIAWQEGDLWMRSMVDWLSTDRRRVDDLKTGGRPAAPHLLANRIVDDGWDVQAAFIERGLDILDPENAGRRKFRFVPLENEEPYGLSVVELTESDLTMGRKKVEHAINIWRRCMATNTWPLYSPKIQRLQRPEYQDRKWLEREVAAEEAERERDGGFVNVLLAG